MDGDDLFRSDLNAARAEFDESERQRDAARRRLQHAGLQAYRSLKAKGYSSARIAREIGVSDGTVRKLGTDGEKSRWRPLSYENYVAIDAYTLRRHGQSWNLAALREAFDSATRELADAKKRLADIAARADGGAPAFELGVLLIPGLPEQRADRSLRQLGDALVSAFATEQDGASVEVVKARLAADDDGPARLVLQRGPSGSQQEGEAKDHRWMVAISPLDHGLVDDRDLRDFMRWLLLTLSWFAAETFDQRLSLTQGLPRARPARWVTSLANIVTGLVGIPLLAVSLALVLACLGALAVPVTRGAGRAAARALARGLGLTFAYTRSEVALDAQVNRVTDDLKWVSDHCERVAVVAYGQGGPVAYTMVRRSGMGNVALLATLGSSLRRYWRTRSLEAEGYPHKAFAGAGGLYQWWLATAVSLVYVPLMGALLVAAIFWAADPLLLVIAGAGTAALICIAVVSVRYARHSLHTEVLERNLKASDLRDPRPWPEHPPWLDLASTADPVADSRYRAAADPLGEIPVEVTYRASTWADHSAYLKPGTEAFRRLLAALTRLAPAPAKLAVQGAGGVAMCRWRVGWLIAARWIAVLSGLPAAIVLLPRLPGWVPGGWRTALAFALLWVMGTAAAFAAMRFWWMAWDLSQRNHEVAVATSTAGNGVHVYAGFVLLLQMFLLALTWPVVLELGWWGELADKGIAATEFVHEGNTYLQGWLLFFEAVLVLSITTTPLTVLLSHQRIRGWLEHRHPLPDPVAATAVLLRLLPEDGLVVNGRRYQVRPIAWDVSVRRFGQRGLPRCHPTPARMLLRDDVVLVDLRNGYRDGRKVARVHGQRVYYAEASRSTDTGNPRLAGLRDWRAFRHDLPELLEKVAARDPTGGYAAEWEGQRTLQP